MVWGMPQKHTLIYRGSYSALFKDSVRDLLNCISDKNGLCLYMYVCMCVCVCMCVQFIDVEE